MTVSNFIQHVQQGGKLISDGATGTNLLARGLPRGKTGESWILENPQAIRQLHQDFIQAGAQIILTCTFGANVYRLEDSNLAGQTIEINHRAVEIARLAIDNKPVLVAGSIGPLGKLLKPFGPLSEEEAVSAYSEQATALCNAGVDLLVIETQFDLNEATTAVKGAHMNCPVPLVVSFSYDRGTRTMMGVHASQMARAMERLDIDVLGINCGKSPEDNLIVLKELRAVSNLPIWFKPNAGLPVVNDQGETHYTLNPQEMGGQVSSWIQAGASIVGGCCGTSPDHLKAIAEAMSRAQ
jgi:5-methyltetrahydrofolate--homocysteine methyltransferase